MEMVRKGPTFPLENWEKYSRSVKRFDSLNLAVGAADLVIEVVPEQLEIKRKVFAELDRLAPAHALLATNSSSIPVSRIESATQRPDKCLNIHFYQPAVGMNMADIMGGTCTSSESLSAARDFVRSVDCVPLQVQKEILVFVSIACGVPLRDKPYTCGRTILLTFATSTALGWSSLG